MRKFLVLLICLGFSNVLFADDKIMYLPIQDALTSKEAKEILDPKIKFEFGKSSKGKVLAKDLISNKRTRKFGKDSSAACNWALLSALKSFQETAIKKGGSKVVNLKGYFKKDSYDSKTNFQCAVGFLMVGVTLKGDIVK